MGACMISVMMTITVEDYESQYWPKLENAINQLLTMTPGEYIPISYEQMYRYLSMVLYFCAVSSTNCKSWKCTLTSREASNVKSLCFDKVCWYRNLLDAHLLGEANFLC